MLAIFVGLLASSSLILSLCDYIWRCKNSFWLFFYFFILLVYFCLKGMARYLRIMRSLTLSCSCACSLSFYLKAAILANCMVFTNRFTILIRFSSWSTFFNYGIFILGRWSTLFRPLSVLVSSTNLSNFINSAKETDFWRILLVELDGISFTSWLWCAAIIFWWLYTLSFCKSWLNLNFSRLTFRSK